MKAWILTGAVVLAGWSGAALADAPGPEADSPEPTGGATTRQDPTPAPDVPAAFQSANDLPTIEREPSPNVAQPVGPRDIQPPNVTAGAPPRADTSAPRPIAPDVLPPAPQGVRGGGAAGQGAPNKGPTAAPEPQDATAGEPPPVETPSPLLNAPELKPTQPGIGGSGVGEPSQREARTAYPEDTPGLPRSTTRAADTPSQGYAPPPGMGAPQAAPPPRPFEGDQIRHPVELNPPPPPPRSERLSAPLGGLTLMAAGGIEGYLGPVSQVVRPGASWGVTLAGRPTRVLGVEVGYSGGASEVNAVGGGDLAVGPDVVRTGANAVVSVGPPWRVQPYLLGGVGVNIYAVHGAAVAERLRSDLAAAVPLGGGVRTRVGRFNADARLDYNLGIGETFAARTGVLGNAGRYQGVLQLGGTF